MGQYPITKEIAAKALKKLDARDITKAGAAHPTYGIFHEGRLVATTGLRHSSNRNIPLPYFPRDLMVPANFVLDLARCPKDRDDWLRRVGEIQDDTDEGGEPLGQA